MKTFEYHPFAQTVTLHFSCPECGEDIATEALDAPQANLMAERAADSQNSDEYEIECPSCGWNSIVNLYTRYDGGYGEVTELEPENDLKVDEELSE